MSHTCRFCKKYIGYLDGIQYASRSWTHFDCYLDRKKPLGALSGWQVGQFPHRLLKDRGLLADAAKIVDEWNAKVGIKTNPLKEV